MSTSDAPLSAARVDARRISRERLTEIIVVRSLVAVPEAGEFYVPADYGRNGTEPVEVLARFRNGEALPL